MVVDYSQASVPIDFSATGPMIETALDLHRQHRLNTTHFVEQLKRIEELQLA